jgi:hypothetical protein
MGLLIDVGPAGERNHSTLFGGSDLALSVFNNHGENIAWARDFIANELKWAIYKTLFITLIIK